MYVYEKTVCIYVFFIQNFLQQISAINISLSEYGSKEVVLENYNVNPNQTSSFFATSNQVSMQQLRD